MAEGHPVVGIDNLNDYYDVELKLARLRQLGFSREDTAGLAGRAQARLVAPGLVLYKADLQDRDAMATIFAAEKPRLVAHLAAQAGVRYSLQNPWAYMDSNLIGFMNILENCRRHPVEHLVFASSSSVYGGNPTQPFSVSHNVDHPLSLYAASKKANELMAHSYSHLFAIPATGLRFFTVYGPWGRPDMALFIFTRKILRGEADRGLQFRRHEARFHLHRRHRRGDVARAEKAPRPNPGWDAAHPDPGHLVGPLPHVQHRQQPAGRPAALHRAHREEPGPGGRERSCCPCSRATCPTTCADIEDLRRHVGFAPATPSRPGWRASSSGTGNIMARNSGSTA